LATSCSSKNNLSWIPAPLSACRFYLKSTKLEAAPDDTDVAVFKNNNYGLVSQRILPREQSGPFLPVIARQDGLGENGGRRLVQHLGG